MKNRMRLEQIQEFSITPTILQHGMVPIWNNITKRFDWVYPCILTTTTTSTTTTTTSTTTTTTTTSTTSTSTTTTTSTTEQQGLKLTFDDITNADLLIGGSSSDVAVWNTFFDLPTKGNPFTSVSVINNEVNLYGGSNITLKDSLFDDIGGYGQSLIRFEDSGCIIHAGYSCFGNADNLGCPNIVIISIPALITAGNECFENLFSITSFDFPSLVTAGISCFASNYISSNTTSLNFPNLITAGDYCFSANAINTIFQFPKLVNVGFGCFGDCYSAISFDLPVCTVLGTTTGNDEVFFDITSKNITLTVPSVLMTCNGGNPDGDIQYLIANNNVTIIQV